MANVSVYNIEGKEVGSIELNDAVFGVEVNEHLVHMAVVNQLANNRQGTQSAKTRSEVSGGGRKPWRQKSYFSLTYACNASVPKNTSDIAHQSSPNGTAEKLLYSLVCPCPVGG